MNNFRFNAFVLSLVASPTFALSLAGQQQQKRSVQNTGVGPEVAEELVSGYTPPGQASALAIADSVAHPVPVKHFHKLIGATADPAAATAHHKQVGTTATDAEWIYYKEDAGATADPAVESGHDSSVGATARKTSHTAANNMAKTMHRKKLADAKHGESAGLQEDFPVEVPITMRAQSLLGSPMRIKKASWKGGATAAAVLALTALACSGRLNIYAGLNLHAAPCESKKQDSQQDVSIFAAIVLCGLVGWFAVMYAIQHGLLAFPFLSQTQALYLPIVLTFIVGYSVIVLEEQTEINKAAVALVLGVSVWALVGTGLGLSQTEFNNDLTEVTEDVSEVVFFVIAALTIVEIMDSHKGFDIITTSIRATKKRNLLLVVGVLTFVLSSILNNLTVVIVMISLLQKIVKDTAFRLRLGGLVVVTSNAGGAWTPIGDITTTMLYIGGQVTAVPLIANLLFPSLLCLIGALGYEYVSIDRDEQFDRLPRSKGEEETPKGQGLVFWGGLMGMMTVPLFTVVTECPAWTGMMLVLGLLGVVTSLVHDPHDDRYNLKGALTRVEVPDALFFLGVLFAVGGLERIGLLKEFAVQLSKVVPSESLVAILLGFASAIVDNVPLVAAAQGMYDLKAHPPNDSLWNLTTFCAASGGSLLVIGSAAGVAFMGLEKEVSFAWYFKHITPPALLGYLIGVTGQLVQQSLGFTVSS